MNELYLMFKLLQDCEYNRAAYTIGNKGYIVLECKDPKFVRNLIEKEDQNAIKREKEQEYIRSFRRLHRPD